MMLHWRVCGRATFSFLDKVHVPYPKSRLDLACEPSPGRICIIPTRLWFNHGILQGFHAELVDVDIVDIVLLQKDDVIP